MSTSQIILPFTQKSNIFLEVSDPVSPDTGEKIAGGVWTNDEDYGIRRLDLADAEWDRLDLKVGFTLETAEIGKLVGSDQGAASDSAAALVSVSCSSAKVRLGVSLASEGPGRWTGAIRLNRETLRGAVALVPQLVRTGAAKEVSAGIAAFDSAIVATGPEVVVVVDRIAAFDSAIVATGPEVVVVVDRIETPYTGPVAYVWERFAESVNTWIAGRPDDVFFLNPGNVPRLHLNLRWASLQPILDSKATTGAPAAMRNTFAAVIAQGAWTQLLTVAALSVSKNDEDGTYGVPDGWRGQLAKVLAEKLYPDADLDHGLARLHLEAKDPDAVGALLGKIGSIAHDASEIARLMDTAGRAISARLVSERIEE